MGRQINFYMSKQVEREFFYFLCQKGYCILYEDYKEKRTCKVKSYDELDESIWLIFLYKGTYGSLQYIDGEDSKIDKLSTPVIEWCRTLVNEKERTVKRGRIWMSDWIEFENLEIEIQFKKDFDSIVRWIRKMVPRQEYNINGYTIKDYINNDIKDYIKLGYKCSV